MTTEADLRNRIIGEALLWDLTPYHTHARVLGVGVDCAQLPAAVYEGAAVIPHLEPEYSSQWMQHRDEELYLEEIRRWSREIKVEAAQPADLLVWKFGRTFSHSGIIIASGVVLHAWARAGRVVRSDLETEEELKHRECKAFTVFAPDGKLMRGGVK
jgi:cell wall-associated NlpC family hydrolase